MSPFELSDVSEKKITDKPLTSDNEKTGAKSSPSVSQKIYFVIKRLFDIVFSFVGLIALIPVSVFTKICYLAEGDKAPIIFKQIRIGKDGKEFKLYKYRSMVGNSEELLEEMLKNPSTKKEWDENQKLRDDPRITKIGRFLRKTSLDELPQCINVFIGDMSMIGPRPLVIGELDSHGGDHRLYESIRPGISGWWAANGRSDISYEKRLELEYYYCENCSFRLDLKCFFMTIRTVILGKGAK